MNLRQKKKKKNKERERKRRGKGEEKQSRRRGGERGARLRETEWTAHLQTLQKSTNTCKEAPQFKWIATAEKKKEKKRKENIQSRNQNPAERLEMSRIRSAKTICSGINRSTGTHIYPGVRSIYSITALLQHFLSQTVLLYCPLKTIL